MLILRMQEKIITEKWKGKENQPLKKFKLWKKKKVKMKIKMRIKMNRLKSRLKSRLRKLKQRK